MLPLWLWFALLIDNVGKNSSMCWYKVKCYTADNMNSNHFNSEMSCSDYVNCSYIISAKNLTNLREMFEIFSNNNDNYFADIKTM